MVFFQPKPAVDDHEKARIEFHLQEIGEAIGFQRFHLPVLRRSDLLDLRSKTPKEVVEFIGNQLSHNVAGIEVRSELLPAEQCGGGG